MLSTGLVTHHTLRSVSSSIPAIRRAVARCCMRRRGCRSQVALERSSCNRMSTRDRPKAGKAW